MQLMCTFYEGTYMYVAKSFLFHTRQCVENFGAKNLREVDRMIQNGTITEDDLKWVIIC